MGGFRLQGHGWQGPLYGDATPETRLWALDYIARNRDMLDLMARL
jgi:hypothetical protein